MATKIATKTKLVNGVSFKFADKKETELAFDLKQLTPAIVLQLAIHGLSQKLGDSYSGLTNVTEAIETVTEVWGNLVNGNFNVRSSGNGGMLAEAIARIKGISVEAAKEVIDALDEDKLETLKKNQRVKDTMTVIKAERATARLSTDTSTDALDNLI